MLLSSSLEPNGPRSIHHYLVLHHEDQRILIKLPESYSDLKKEVEGAYHIDRDRFYIETKELNVCAGERIRIPEEAWSDVSKLLGNVYVVPCSKQASKSEKAIETEATLKSEGVLESVKPPKSQEALTNKEGSKKEERLKGGERLKKYMKEAWKREEKSKGGEPLKPKSFSGPETVSLPTPVQVVQSGPKPLATPLNDKVALYEQILACDPRVPGVLAAIWEERKSSNRSRSGVNWRSQRIPFKTWADFVWDVRGHSIVAVRYNLAEDNTEGFRVRFRASATKLEFHIVLGGVADVTFLEVEDGGNKYRYHTYETSLTQMCTAGDHSIVLVNHGGQIHVFFDFREFTILPRATMIKQRPDQIYMAEVPGITTSMQVGVYDFT